MVERLFGLKKNGTTVRTEITAGVTTFMTMAYILAVCPNIMGQTGMPSGGVFVATVGAAFAGTLFMALFANYPFALAPALIVVGAMMLSAAAEIDFSDLSESIPAFLTITSMAFTYSVADGIMWGIIGYAGVHLFSGRWRDVHWIVYVLSALFIAKYALI